MRQPTRYGHEGEVGLLVSDTNQDDPLTYADAMDDSDKEKWLEAMNQEMDVGCGKIFCAPDQIGKTKLAEALVP